MSALSVRDVVNGFRSLTPATLDSSVSISARESDALAAKIGMSIFFVSLGGGADPFAPSPLLVVTPSEDIRFFCTSNVGESRQDFRTKLKREDTNVPY